MWPIAASRRSAAAGTLLEEQQQVVAIELEQLGVGQRDRGRGARAAVEQRELAENFAGAGDREHDLLAGRVLDEQLDLAATHDEQRFARLAGLEQRVAGGELFASITSARFARSSSSRCSNSSTSASIAASHGMARLSQADARDLTPKRRLSAPDRSAASAFR